MSVDKNYCMSSYLAFRYVAKNGVEYFDGLHHPDTVFDTDVPRLHVNRAEEIDSRLSERFEALKGNGKRLGILLSGGMDSACLASYLPEGTDAYTFRFLGGSYQKEELSRAEHYAAVNKLMLHYVDISWNDVETLLPILLRSRNEPMHSIEVQLYKACTQAKADGVDRIIYGDCADMVFGGLDRMISREWDFDEFVHWYLFTDPADVLCEPVDIRSVFEPYRHGNKIDYIGFMQREFSAESTKCYYHAFDLANIAHLDPYEEFSTELDLARIRRGDTKYLIRELFRMKYPDAPVPEKVPMPRPVDVYFKDWTGPKRREFKPGLDMKRFSGDQKWQLWCLEYFLNMFDSNQVNA